MGAMAVAAKEVLGVDQVPCIPVHGRTDKSIVADLLAAIGRTDVADNAASQPFLEEYYRQLPEALVRQRGRALPGIGDLIEHLAVDPDFELGILTGNLKTAAEIKLDHIGLRSRFAFGGYGDDEPDRNDVAATAVTQARTRLGDRFCESNLWVIGDTPNDIRCGRHVGAKVLAVETGGGTKVQLSQSGPDLQFADWTDDSVWRPWIASMKASLMSAR